MIVFFLRVKIKCLIGHMTKSNHVFDVSIPKCEQGEI